MRLPKQSASVARTSVGRSNRRLSTADQIVASQFWSIDCPMDGSSDSISCDQEGCASCSCDRTGRNAFCYCKCGHER
jgi:hypothetical protein